MTKNATAASRQGHAPSKSEFAELTRAEATKLIREWALAGASETDLVAVSEWEIEDIRRALAGESR